jgi:hypothetical protein
MGLVNELQISAEREDVLTVLRKTKRLATKLGRTDMSEWLRSEQSGYAAGQSVPDYRVINTTIAMNTNGFIPEGYGYVGSGIKDLPCGGLDLRYPLRDSISSVLATIEQLGGNNQAYVPVDNDGLAEEIRDYFRINPMFAHQVSFVSKLNRLQIRAIPEQIKDRVLEWACDLEAAGVTGDGLSFSEQEKQIAHSITFNIHNSTIGQLNNQGINLRFDRE